MNKISETILKAVKSLSLKDAFHETNSSCIFLAYQPEMPQEVKQLREKKLIKE